MQKAFFFRSLQFTVVPRLQYPFYNVWRCFRFIFIIFLDVYACVSVCNFVHVNEGALGNQKRSSGPSGLENIWPLRAGVSHLTWVLRIELQRPGRRVRTLNL